jgi:midasin
MRLILLVKGEPGRVKQPALNNVSAAPKNSGGPSGDDELDNDGPVDSSGAPMSAEAGGQPQKSLGDIMKDIKRRRDEILDQQEKDNRVDNPSAPQEGAGQVEHIGEDEEGDDQALGRAEEEERQKLADLNIVDEEEQGEAPERRGMEDDGEEVEAADQEGAKGQAPERSVKQERQERDGDKALMGNEIGGDAPMERPDDQMEVDDDREDTIEAKREVEDDDDDTPVELNEVTKVEDETLDGEMIWRQHAALTSDLSYALCEQLRLILEPTLATRLQGDFRTGKRLNMRKIIPYIASEYTKDKIWLRRTKPSRREYQVLLSLDDSRSMADSHSVHLAYQTLALVSQAMNKLEVGQVAIAKFGESVDILHPFGTGFTDADGAKVVDAFKFDQNRTDVVKLVERTLTFLAESRQNQPSSSNADLWQLQIIISDGVCQDHAKLRRLLRRALEERVMIVFIVIDSLHTTTTGPNTAGAGRTSILSMQTVEYKNVGGEMQLEMTRYLDTFPFEFFVVLRDVEALPGVLADTLRQWMARVSQSQE